MSPLPRGGTAFPHRDALFYSEPGAGWGTRGVPDSGDELTPQAQAWIAEFSQALRPYVNGAYASNFDRLRKIKAKYDPRNVFQYEQSILGEEVAVVRRCVPAVPISGSSP
ncbi:BBE domain-containing protein [Streptomyces sp. NPDC057908]|uniref:BBE domain-containing protein n=1 Tax=Streptomyces sp. NPDC057908 TaxID=3346276 RepID=UPI0036E346C5